MPRVSKTVQAKNSLGLPFLLPQALSPLWVLGGGGKDVTPHITTLPCLSLHMGAGGLVVPKLLLFFLAKQGLQEMVAGLQAAFSSFPAQPD